VIADRGVAFGGGDLSQSRGWRAAANEVLRGVAECGFITNNASSSTAL
jgi:hypothetical protein